MINDAKANKSTANGMIYLLIVIFFSIVLIGIMRSNIFKINYSNLQNFSIILLSIILEALPFIMLGAFISALIQVFISEEMITRIIPKNTFWGLLGASLMGLIFPVCECAIIPIVRGLIKKGVPTSIAVTFMLAVPIVNPVVLTSTYYAFYDKPSMVLIRGGLGVMASIIIGFFIKLSSDKNESILKNNSEYNRDNCPCGCGLGQGIHRGKQSKVKLIIDHTNNEMFQIGKYLIFGAIISALFQAFIPRSYVSFLGEHQLYSVIAMMALAFILSLCSEADAFIARTFLSQFTIGSVSAFLILGPMLDIKNALMLFGSFKKSFVIKLIIFITLVCMLIGAWINFFVRIGVIS